MDNQPAEERTRDSIEQTDINTSGISSLDSEHESTGAMGGILGDDTQNVRSDHDDTTDQDAGQASGAENAEGLPRISSTP